MRDHNSPLVWLVGIILMVVAYEFGGWVGFGLFWLGLLYGGIGTVINAHYRGFL